jgi:hypothetical protein
MIRSSISLWTHLETSNNNNNNNGGRDGPSSSLSSSSPNVVASVISVNGSARTAKLATMAQVRKRYRPILRKDNNLKGNDFQRACGKLEETLLSIQNID